MLGVYGTAAAMLCCVDVLQVTVDGPSLITMPGTLAKHYKQLGGFVQLMGKPDPLIYAAAQELAGASSVQSSGGGQQQWLAVGDSLEHDIAG
jgi:ribonucleotide monophosphatase NagD (HAD superfamily)